MQRIFQGMFITAQIVEMKTTSYLIESTEVTSPMDKEKLRSIYPSSEDTIKFTATGKIEY